MKPKPETRLRALDRAAESCENLLTLAVLLESCRPATVLDAAQIVRSGRLLRREIESLQEALRVLD